VGSRLDAILHKGLGIHNDLQNEHSIVGINPFVQMAKAFATTPNTKMYGERLLRGEIRAAFGLTEPNHGSDATFMETRAVREQKDCVPGWRINGEKM
jgi:acyl-CoA dehydrogenase